MGGKKIWRKKRGKLEKSRTSESSAEELPGGKLFGGGVGLEGKTRIFITL